MRSTSATLFDSEGEELAIAARGVVKRFGSRTAVSGIDLSVSPGMVYGLLGPNGAGKSTLVRMLCGVLRPDAGRIQILGWHVPSLRVQLQLGYMPQEVALYGDLTVAQNLRMFARLYDLPRAQIRERVGELLELVRLSDRRDDRVAALSGGMQRRASLAASLVHRPRVLFLDEPTAGVDLQLRTALWDYFLSLGEQEVTLLVTTHLLEEAERCARLGFLQGGRLLAEGTVPELLEGAHASDLEAALSTILAEREATS